MISLHGKLQLIKAYSFGAIITLTTCVGSFAVGYTAKTFTDLYHLDQLALSIRHDIESLEESLEARHSFILFSKYHLYPLKGDKNQWKYKEAPASVLNSTMKKVLPKSTSEVTSPKPVAPSPLRGEKE